MALHVTVPISTEGIESNPDCTISGAYEDGVLMITLDTRPQHIPQRLGLGTKTRLHWGPEHVFEAQELSALAWPIRYRVLTRDGYYVKDEQRGHVTPAAHGLDARRAASAGLLRAAVLLVIVAGVGSRRTAWLREPLFHVKTSKSAVHRWVEEIADSLPSADEMIKALHAKQPITAAHVDELFPRGSKACVLVLTDEHGRLIATHEVDKCDEVTGAPFLERMQRAGLELRAFDTDGCTAYDNAIRSVFGRSMAIQYDDFHLMQHVWRHLWKWAVARRRQIQARSQQVATPWDKQQLEALAKSLWKNRYLLFKADARLTAEEQARLVEIVAAERHVGKLRAFLGGVWRLFEESQEAQEACAALAALKQLPVDQQQPEQFRKVVSFLAEHFAWMTAYLRHEGVQRHSLAESGRRVLRRLEVEHDGFRSETERTNCLRISQAVKYRGWTVHRLPIPQANPP